MFIILVCHVSRLRLKLSSSIHSDLVFGHNPTCREEITPWWLQMFRWGINKVILSRGRVWESPKSLGFILWGTWLSAEHLTKICFKYWWDISVWNQSGGATVRLSDSLLHRLAIMLTWLKHSCSSAGRRRWWMSCSGFDIHKDTKQSMFKSHRRRSPFKFSSEINEKTRKRRRDEERWERGRGQVRRCRHVLIKTGLRFFLSTSVDSCVSEALIST